MPADEEALGEQLEPAALDQLAGVRGGEQRAEGEEQLRHHVLVGHVRTHRRQQQPQPTRVEQQPLHIPEEGKGHGWRRGQG